MYKIVIDTKGSDKGAAVIVGGAAEAIKAQSDLSVVLVGDSELIRAECESLGVPSDREFCSKKGGRASTLCAVLVLYYSTPCAVCQEGKLKTFLQSKTVRECFPDGVTLLISW